MKPKKIEVGNFYRVYLKKGEKKLRVFTFKIVCISFYHDSETYKRIPIYLGVKLNVDHELCPNEFSMGYMNQCWWFDQFGMANCYADKDCEKFYLDRKIDKPKNIEEYYGDFL